MKDLNIYLHSWVRFETNCENKVKDVCIINTKGWRKLREYHMDTWLRQHSSPFGFMFKLKYQHNKIYRSIPCASKFYCITRQWRDLKFEREVDKSVITFPSWKGYLTHSLTK